MASLSTWRRRWICRRRLNVVGRREGWRQRRTRRLRRRRRRWTRCLGQRTFGRLTWRRFSRRRWSLRRTFERTSRGSRFLLWKKLIIGIKRSWVRVLLEAGLIFFICFLSKLFLNKCLKQQFWFIEDVWSDSSVWCWRIWRSYICLRMSWQNTRIDLLNSKHTAHKGPQVGGFGLPPLPTTKLVDPLGWSTLARPW